jgi:signal transduction histidine kinase
LVQPFERGMGAERAGSGLGLAIAQAIMRFHHGTLELVDNCPGVMVRLRFVAMDATAMAL